VLAGRRYIVCRNHQEAAKDAADRASIIAALERQLAKGDKALVGNTGYRRYLKRISQDHFEIDPDKVEEEKRFDGIFVLRTNTDFNPLEAMLCYKQLWTVEQTFRTAKDLFSTRPIFHKVDEISLASSISGQMPASTSSSPGTGLPRQTTCNALP
jgi:hypothetical protein